MNSLTLLPMPRHLEIRAGTYPLQSDKRIALIGAQAQELLFSGERLCEAFRVHANLDWTLAATATGPRAEIGAVLRVDSGRMSNPEAYELDITYDGIHVTAGSPHGIFNAVSTLIQLVQQPNHLTTQQPNSHTPTLPCLHVADSPDFPNRGVMLDISRDKVPTMATLFELVDMLASWKINQLQLYTEHTFAYRDHREVWEHASPLTEQEILELDRFCRERFITLVPNQNSFGHMHRWLKHERYRDLAECPDADTPHWWGPGPFSLNPTDPRTLEFLRGLYDELLPNFSARQFNVGCDETFDLGEGRSKQACAERGVGRVYLDFLLKIHRDVQARGLTMMFWGDIITQHPELIPELPQDAIALEWGYESDHPFDEDGAAFAQAGIPFYVCPGTSSWNSIAGRTDNAMQNILNAAENGLKHGAIGLLNTDWGDHGHWQHLPISYLGFGYGAALSWCVESNRKSDLPRALDRFAFQDSAGVMGTVASELGNAHRELGIEFHNSTALFRFLVMPLEEIREMGGLTRDSLNRTLQAIERAVEPLAKAQMQRADGELIRQEFENAAQLLRHAARRAMLALENDAWPKSELVRDLDAILESYTRLWQARNRPGGFDDSIAGLKKSV